MRLPPFRFTLWGKIWKVRYGDSKRKDNRFYKYSRNGGILFGETDIAKRTIYLNPTLLRDDQRVMLWRTFAHECMHAFDMTTRGSGGKKGLKHDQIRRLEGPFGSWLAENVGTTD